MMRQLNYIDVFAGAGGLSEGFVRKGFHGAVHVEMNADACETLKTRECYHYLKQNQRLEIYYNYLRGNIDRQILRKSVPATVYDSILCRTMSSNSMNQLFGDIDRLLIEQNINTVDLLVGGPPCQAYSLVGRARCSNNMVDDPRNYLYKLYRDMLKKYKPRMFVFENVPGLLTAEKGVYFDSLKREFGDAGYELKHKLLNAADFGVLQNRKRIILIGWRKGSKLSYPRFYLDKFPNTVNDVLSDLPSLQAGETGLHYSNNTNDYLVWSKIRNDKDVLTWHVARPHNDRDREIYRHVITAWNNHKKRIKYIELPESLCTHNNRNSFLDRYKIVAGDLETSQTIVAHIAKDGHYYIHPDFRQARSLTVREAARIQSFPDDYFFEGSRTSAFSQIGNAVPPLMAEGIATGIIEQLT